MNDTNALTGQVALITGGAGGIGSVTARVLAERGASVILTGTREISKIQSVVDTLPGKDHLAIQAAVDKKEDWQRVKQAVESTYGTLDILMNNAGFTRFAAPEDLEGLDDELIDKIFQINWRGPFAGVRTLQPLLEKGEGGLIINTSSIAGTTAIGSNIAYCASKSALNTMTMALARALAPKIRVVAIAPGLVEGKYSKKLDQAWCEEQAKLTPLGRLTQPEDVAEAVVAIATLLKFSTGFVLPVDGGRPLT
jgi:3-oxoacyl-[acyl-carrier protein] reductase